MDSEFTGDLTFKGSFRIEGTFHGTIKSDSLLVIGENGKVDAEIDVGHLVVNGEVKGVLQAREKVEIHGKGRVYGKINLPQGYHRGRRLPRCQLPDPGNDRTVQAGNGRQVPVLSERTGRPRLDLRPGEGVGLLREERS